LENDLKSSYKKQSLKFHPDLNPGGQEMFLLVSEAFQTLKDDDKKALYTERYQKAINRQYDTSEPRYAREQTFTSAEDFFRRAGANPADYEELFRQFHRSTNTINLLRMSQIAGSLGAILGIMIGLLFSVGILAIPGAFLGFIIGRSNPFLAPLLLGVTRFVAWICLFILGGMTIMTKQFLIFGLILIGAWLFFSQCRSWARELSRG
jgi:hypothetical protein